jgi:DNA N-6-adenine-methyltransferase (Dam)
MTMGSHQTTIGKSQVHLTPRRILDPLGAFDLDPCGNDPRPWDCANLTYTEADNGLALPWFGRAWLNPPFHRYQIAGWLKRMAEHDRGIVLVHARTETDWFNIVRHHATALFWIAGRVIFCQADGSPQIVSNPASKHYGKVANSGAPVVLASFGFDDCDVLADLPAAHDGAQLSKGLFGTFDPLLWQRFILIGGFRDATWRELVVEILRASEEPIAVADLYRAFRDHPKTKSNPHWREKLRQTLQRGAGRSVARDQWVAA